MNKRYVSAAIANALIFLKPKLGLLIFMLVIYDKLIHATWLKKITQDVMRYCICLLSLYCFPGIAEDFKVNLFETSITDERRMLVESYFTRVYEPLKITPTFYYLPARRGLELVNSGDFDAEAGRFKAIGQPYDNLIKIETPIATLETVVICLTQRNCKDLREASIGILSGFESARDFCEELSSNCMFDPSPEVLAKALESDVLTSLMLIKDDAYQVLCELSVNSLFYSNQPKFTRESYHWVNAKHKNLVSQLNSSIEAANNWYRTFNNSETWIVKLEKCGKQIQSVPE